MNSRFQTPVLFVCAAILFSGCSSHGVKTIDAAARIALISGTAPESPYKSYSPELHRLIAAVNRDNPAIVLHLGNMIFAGNTPGLRESDVLRQLDERKPFFSKLDPVCDYTAGELDHFGGTAELFEKETGRSALHSFQYGTLHFLAIDSNDGGPAEVSPSQKLLIERDLERSGDSAVIILSCRPFFLQKNLAGYTQTVAKAEEFHQLFLKHRVRAVFSASGEIFSRVDRDSISYINAGSVPVYKNGYDQPRYYIVEITKDTITASGRKL